uniref:Adenylate cyclase 10 n=1 Tax=Varanus komodoensis TaxID=61221 RepID=A0A8D2LEC9_VARKO
RNTPKERFSTLGKVAAHVPDLIVYGDFSQDVPFIESFDGVLLFVDISGWRSMWISARSCTWGTGMGVISTG